MLYRTPLLWANLPDKKKKKKNVVNVIHVPVGYADLSFGL